MQRIPHRLIQGPRSSRRKISQGQIQSWLSQGMMMGFKNAYDCIKAFSETDFTEDLKKFDAFS